MLIFSLSVLVKLIILVYFSLYLCYLDYLICSLVGEGKGFFGAGCGCINQVGDLCPIVKHLYLYESINK